ncbi:hypothetical protein CNMCM6936_006361 [Aspergillus lentulus]|nr:hypothetical protein CNMCM6069_002452 [Aspergillus lentulus]KAF4166654.1 hypothetical protein CNMCM6936_006361 [Aspergillus lentulus]
MTSLSPPHPRPDEASEKPPKRRKVAVACDECRARKVRCDGIQPVCGPCMKRSDARCVYTGEPEKRRAVRNYIATLENKIRHLENKGGPQASGYTQVSPSVESSEQLSPSQTVPLHRLYGRDGFSAGNGGQSSNAVCRRSERPLDAEAGDDGVNAMMGSLEEERQTQGFFGSSSATSFMRQIKTAVEKRVDLPDRRTSESILGTAPQSSPLSNRTKRPSTVSNYVLPPRKTADSLMEVYWCFVFPLYPLVDSIHLRAEYSKLWTGETLDSDENMLMCTLNVIFALACQLADFIARDEREASADAFFSRAKDLLHFNLWHGGSAALIQCLLLMAQYLQSTDSAHQCWIVTGLAIRNAQSLGLHLPQTIAHLPSFQEQQLARKIWHGCVLMDRVISMTFGRPAMISKASCSSVPLPATVDEEYIPAALGGEVRQPADRPSLMAFYAKSLELYEILNDILLSLYKPVPEENPEDIYDFYFNKGSDEGERTIFELDRALTKWTQSLPPHLRGDTFSKPVDAVFYHQSVVLRARFLHVRMLLFRPILSKYCTARDITPQDPLTSVNDSFPQRVAQQCSIICVKVAQEVIELIHSNIPADGSAGPLPAWWYNILSRRCVAALEILYEKVVSEGPPRNEPSTHAQVSTFNSTNDMSLGEGMNAILLEGFDMPDFQDMSWLNSVPSNLY